MKFLKTPGHTKESLSFYFPKEQLLFSGDFIFKKAIGRFDFPESSSRQMQEILLMISHYPDNLVIFPGHGDSTILGEEKKKFINYF